MSFPINGRIAIIDDQLKQVEPLIKVLSKKQYPFSYFNGDLRYLPNEDSIFNDYRIIFLDINLIDDREHEPKILKGRLIPVLNKIISKNNFPFVIVFWSRHKEHYKLVEEIFSTELTDRKPIGFLQQESKLDYFDFDGSEAPDLDKKVDELFANIDKLFNNNPAFSYLLNWENEVHKSADRTLEEIFNFENSIENWENNANYIFTKLGLSYSGKHYDGSKLEDKINSSYQAFNNVFLDSLEYSTNNSQVNNLAELLIDKSKINSQLVILGINKKLLISEEYGSIEYPGEVLEYPLEEPLYKELLNKILSLLKIKEQIKSKNNQVIDLELKKMADKEAKAIRDEIKKSWKCIIAIVTPLCDFVQKENKKYNRIVKGVLIKSIYKQFIDDKSEAIFISPSFLFEHESYILILDFRYFYTDNFDSRPKLQPIFRLRQQILSEIQSKLARHISRQGILFLDIN